MQKWGKTVRSLYLYLITAVAMIMFVIAFYGFLNTLLENFVFKVRSWEFYNIDAQCSDTNVLYQLDKNGKEIDKYPNLTSEEKEKIKNNCKVDAENKIKQQSYNDVKRNIANNLAMLLVALPLYLYHWKLIRRERKENLDEN